MNKGMKAFWEWMEKKGFGDNQCGEKIVSGERRVYATEQMLIGYMIEYLREKRKNFQMYEDTEDGWEIEIDCHCYYRFKSLYRALEKAIGG